MEMSKTFNQIKVYANRHNIPIIPITGSDVSLLQQPITFYETILSKIRNAKDRVALSALYIGTGEKEEALLQALCNSLEEKPSLNVRITLDANRARRTDSSGRSSVSALQSILLHGRAKLNLIQTAGVSGFAQGFLSRFQKWNELSSTYHSKILIFDDDIILTGANLSSIYFERRRDRYLTISGCKPLSNYIYGFLNHMDVKKGHLLDALVKDYNKMYTRDTHDAVGHDTDCCILPMFQCGPHNIHTCDDFLQFLGEILPKTAKIHLSSGYFNPALETRFNSVLAPSEEANGFHNGAGLLGFVPRLYTALMKRYMDANPQCQMHLYKKPGWSYHAKGLWVEGLDDLFIHMIGSSNFNSRSSSRDFELQFLILTRNPELARNLEDERLDLLRDSVKVVSTSEWNLNPLYKLAARILKSLL